VALDFRDGLIATIYLVINPDKLRHLCSELSGTRLH
jgi:hypothetical protein